MTNRKQISLIEIVLYGTAMNFGIRWMATGAATGPVAIGLWVLAAVLFLGPLVIATMEMSARFPEDGAVYAWTRKMMGPYAGFLCGWIYWACNLPYFASLLLFSVNLLALAIGGPIGVWLSEPLGSMIVTMSMIIVVGGLHYLGLGVGKWLPVVGGIASLSVFAIVVVCGIWLSQTQGSATDFAKATYIPPLNADGAILWGTMVFAFGGAEGIALLRNDLKGGAKSMVKALMLIGLFLSLAYALGTAGMLMILPQEEASRLGGLPESLKVALIKLEQGGFVQLAYLALALSTLGGLSAWFGAAARLPFAAGLDEGLPKGFATLDPKTGAPVAAIVVQTVLVILILFLAQSGSTLARAYDFVIAMSVLSYAVPFLFLFVSYFKAQKLPAEGLDWRTPFGSTGARIVAILGFVIASSAIACSFVPIDQTPKAANDIINLMQAALVLIASGTIFYLFGRIKLFQSKE